MAYILLYVHCVGPAPKKEFILYSVSSHKRIDMRCNLMHILVCNSYFDFILIQTKVNKCNLLHLFISNQPF